ncbi:MULTISPECIES: hypothetical protein [Streptomyces]|uniref:Uncharacterized protein n=1 Tax=Streptomyces harbinensis TaxID=1176198 RepID=A0A1I6WBA3_9ACTN|nr:hypothetical protein [Streptomyces ginkgonis]SFT23287.1 hypothetical protein SAMN05444716_11714 [Streptomyces harbinensis]
MADILLLLTITDRKGYPVAFEPGEGEQPSPRREPLPQPIDDALQAWSQPLAPVRDLDEVARRYPGRRLTLDGERTPLEFYGRPEQPNAFAMDSLEFFLLIAQFFREALPLRLILLLIACQRAGGRIHLTQEEMATVLDVARPKASEALQEIMSHGIVYKVKRGVYQFNPPFSYRVAEFIPGTETAGGKSEYRRVEQCETISEIRQDATLPELVRFPSLEHMRRAIEELRAERAAQRAQRRRNRAERRDEGMTQ